MKEKKLSFNLSDRLDVQDLKKLVNKIKKIPVKRTPDELTVYNSAKNHKYVGKCENCQSLFFIDKTVKYCPICGDEDIYILGKTQPKLKYNVKITKKELEQDEH